MNKEIIFEKNIFEDEKEHLVADEDDAPQIIQDIKEKWRNLIGFWVLGLTNNFAYVVMLSAAFDILGNKIGDKDKDDGKYHCNPRSTGIILLADIVPSLVIKVTAPFYMQRISYNIRVTFVVILAIGGLLLVALTNNLGVSLLGVALTSFSSGLGEITFLSLTSHFQSSTISAWSSGTGAAGVFPSLVYAGFTSLGVSPKNTIFIMLVVPFFMGVGFWGLLKPVQSFDAVAKNDKTSLINKRSLDATSTLPLKGKLHLMKPLLQYMIPLFLVYFAEYLINQGLFEILYYPNSIMNHSEQYRWLQFCYQLGVLISRSTIHLIKINKIELLSALQFVNFIVLFLEAYYRYIPNVWITFGVGFFEGLIGGAVYVNTFYRITTEVEPKYREFSMGAASMADSTGITLAGLTAVPLHTYLCKFGKSPLK